MSPQEQLSLTRVALAALLNLIERGVLVRSIENDGDYLKFMKDSTQLVIVLKQAQEVLR